jgi:hypothetical protein
MSLGRYQMAEHFQTGVNLTRARVGIMFLPSSAKDFVPDGVVLRTPGFSIRPLDTFALWSPGNVDPLIHRVLGPRIGLRGIPEQAELSGNECANLLWYLGHWVGQVNIAGGSPETEMEPEAVPRVSPIPRPRATPAPAGSLFVDCLSFCNG